MLLTLTKKARSGYVIAFLLLVTSYILIFLTIQELIRATNILSHTYTLVNKLEELRSSVVDAETGVRGYVISQDARFLKPYNEGTKKIPVIFEELKDLTADNPKQLNDLDKLNQLVKRKVGYMTDGLAIFQSNGFKITDSMVVAREPSRIAMDSVRLLIDQMKATEEGLMHTRKAELSQFFSGSKIITVISLVIAILAIFFSWFTYNQENKAKIEADGKAEKYREDLEKNILKLKETNNELQELRSIEKFAATGRIARTIAHEVRNPLTNISLATEQLQEAMEQYPDSKDLLNMIGRNANRINGLVSELLNATRFVQLDFRKININQLMDETLESAKDRIDLSNTRVEKQYSSDPCIVAVDVDKIKLALLNIIVNALEAMEKGKGILRIKTKRAGEKCVVEINDNGMGMDEDTLQKLFEPYFTGKTNGNGLGLTNTQNIILNHKGNIKVYSRPGEGASFVVSLNIATLA